MAASAWSTMPHIRAGPSRVRVVHLNWETLGQSRNAVSVAPQAARGLADDAPAIDGQRQQVNNALGCVTRVTYVRFGHTMLN